MQDNQPVIVSGWIDQLHYGVSTKGEILLLIQRYCAFEIIHVVIVSEETKTQLKTILL